MNVEGLYLGVDVGTQGTKGLLLDTRRREIVARAGISYPLLPGLPVGAAEQHPETWIDALSGVARRLLSSDGVDRSQVRGVGVSGQQHGLVVLDDEDRVLRPAKLWCDTSAAAEAAELSQTIGRAVPSGFTAPKILWLARREPETWRRVRSVLLPHDYVNFRLTGRKAMEAGDASGTGLFDPVARAFDERAMMAVDSRMPALLPPLVEAGTPVGALSGAGAELVGLAPGLLVSSGGGDNMMSAIGSGATRPGVVVASLGTSGTAFAYSAAPIVDPQGEIAAFCDSTGGWLPLLCVMNMTGVTEEVCRAFGSDVAALTDAAARVPAGADGLLLVPYLQGERVPDLPEATGVLDGIRPGLLRPAHLFRAALEGTSLGLALGIERMKGLGIAVDALRLVGGGAKNRLWRQILADVLEVPVMRLGEPESAALGAAVHAYWTARRQAGEPVDADTVAQPFVRIEGEPIAPNPATAPAYRDARQRLRVLTERLFSPEATS